MKFILSFFLVTSAYAGQITSKSLSIDPSVATDIKPTKIPVKTKSKFKLTGTCTYGGKTYKSVDDGYKNCIALQPKSKDAKSFKSSSKDGAVKEASFTIGN